MMAFCFFCEITFFFPPSRDYIAHLLNRKWQKCSF
jgi:hypothetical protein